MFNLIVKDPERHPPERAAFGSGTQPFGCASSNLCAVFWLRGIQRRPFWANFLRVSNRAGPVKLGCFSFFCLRFTKERLRLVEPLENGSAYADLTALFTEALYQRGSLTAQNLKELPASNTRGRALSP